MIEKEVERKKGHNKEKAERKDMMIEERKKGMIKKAEVEKKRT